MPAKWKDKELNHLLLVERLRGYGSMNSEGRPVFKGMDTDILLELLAAAIEFNKTFPQELIYRTLLSASLSAFQAGKLDVDGLLASVQNEERKYLQKARQKFIVVTRISLKLGKKRIVRRFGENSVVFRQALPSSINVEWEREDAIKAGVILPPDEYAWALAYVHARTDFEAYRTGIDSINLVRSLWNYPMNRRHYSRVMLGPEKPINRILCGSVTTVHYATGKRPNSSYWHDKSVDYLQPPSAIEFPKLTEKMFKEERRLRNELGNSWDRRKVEGFLIEYTRACDNTDKHTAFLDLWRLLEKITFSAYKSFDVTIRRAARFYANHEYQRLKLGIIRRIRNEAIHVGGDHNIIDAHVYELKCTVEDVLRRLVKNPFKFTNIKEWEAFLELPFEPKELREQIQMRKNALKWSK